MYQSARRPAVLKGIESAGMRWQMESLYRQLDLLQCERTGVDRAKKSVVRKLPIVERFQTVPGVGVIVSQTVAAWVVDPKRFRNRSALNSYAGLGLGQGVTNWKPVGKTKASRRGQRQVKRVLLLAAKAAARGDNALARRYKVRREAGWEHAKAIRDIARELLWILCALWRTRKTYDDSLVSSSEKKRP